MTIRVTSRTTLRALALPLLLGAVVTASVPGLLIRVNRGDTLSAIAARYHTTVAALIALNHLPGNGDLIYAGSLLRVSGPATSTTSAAASAAPAPTTESYTVRPGDTAGAVASSHHTTLSWLRAHNPLDSTYTIYVDQRLTVPAMASPTPASASANTFAGRTYSNDVVTKAAWHRAELAGRSVPSRDGIRALIVAAAGRYGVDPALALAVAQQESGFQQQVVSPADAIGVMQVLPSTGEYVSTSLVHRPLDLLDTEDNVTAGVALLGMLTHAAKLEDAVAGYYQGLGSVQRNGMYDDTKTYVASVLALRSQYAGH